MSPRGIQSDRPDWWVGYTWSTMKYRADGENLRRA